MVNRISSRSTWVYVVALGAVVVVAAALATSLHMRGHAQGDDFALYLRQARSVFQGDMGQVVADNRFAVLNSDPRFSPMAYPWGWPLLLSPFVKLWGLQYDKLKLVVVACMCIWLVLLHGIVRRRIGRGAALGVVAVLATAPAFLRQTDQLLSEFPFLASIALVLWWYDRIRARGPLIRGSFSDLAILGVLASAAFNVRREGVVLVFVIIGMQLFELLTVTDTDDGGRPIRAVRNMGQWGRTIVMPVGAFVAATVTFQLLVPTTLFPQNGDGPGNIPDRLGELPGVLTSQIGFGDRPKLGVAIIVVAVIGAVLGVRRRPALDLPLVLLTTFTTLLVATHFRLVSRYWFQVTPWIIYFFMVAVVELAVLLFGNRPAAIRAVIAVPLVALLVAHLLVLPGDVRDVREFNADGRVQWGPAHPAVEPVFDAVSRLTPPDAVIAFYRARTMTLLTDRRAIQSTNFERVLRGADYFAQRRQTDYSQIKLTEIRAKALGFEKIWSDANWVLWKLR